MTAPSCSAVAGTHRQEAVECGDHDYAWQEREGTLKGKVTDEQRQNHFYYQKTPLYKTRVVELSR